jgi:hypothetical protein
MNQFLTYMIHIENDAMKKEVSAAKEHVEMLQDVQNTFMQ